MISTWVFLVLICSFFKSSESFCWGSGIYHVAAEALAMGIGPIDSQAVCVYGNLKDLDAECPLTCQTLLATAWGDCYCRNPNYKPKSFDADNAIKNLSVYDMFKFLSENTQTDAPHATCRLWLKEKKQDWHCGKTMN